MCRSEFTVLEFSVFQFLWAYYWNFTVYCKIPKIEDSIISALQSIT